jgi:hypothetical protein
MALNFEVPKAQYRPAHSPKGCICFPVPLNVSKDFLAANRCVWEHLGPDLTAAGFPGSAARSYGAASSHQRSNRPPSHPLRLI